MTDKNEYWYRVSFGSIKKVKVDNVTEKMVFFSNSRGYGNKEKKKSSYADWFKTFEGAKAHTLLCARNKVYSLEVQLESARKKRDEAKTLTEEDCVNNY